MLSRCCPAAETFCSTVVTQLAYITWLAHDIVTLSHCCQITSRPIHSRDTLLGPAFWHIVVTLLSHCSQIVVTLKSPCHGIVTLGVMLLRCKHSVTLLAVCRDIAIGLTLLWHCSHLVVTLHSHCRGIVTPLTHCCHLFVTLLTQCNNAVTLMSVQFVTQLTHCHIAVTLLSHCLIAVTLSWRWQSTQLSLSLFIAVFYNLCP